MPSSKVPLPLVKCCIYCPFKLHPEKKVSPVLVSGADPPLQGREEAELVAGEGGQQKAIDERSSLPLIMTLLLKKTQET